MPAPYDWVEIGIYNYRHEAEVARPGPRVWGRPPKRHSSRLGLCFSEFDRPPLFVDLLRPAEGQSVRRHLLGDGRSGGGRGVGGRRGNRIAQETMNQLNEEVLLVLQIEHRDALDRMTREDQAGQEPGGTSSCKK